jgi:tetratricopeptide (TPR) repeat protein
MAAVHLADQKWDDARGELERALAIPGADPEISLEYGLLCQRAEDWNGAFDAFRGIPPDHQSFRMAQYQIGRSAVMSGERLDEGADALLAYLDHTPRGGMPSKAWAHVRLGQVYEKQGRRAEARAQYQAALELEPDHEEAQKALRSLHNGA